MFSVPTWILLGRTVWNKMMSTWKCHSLSWKSSMVPRKLGGATASHLHFNFSFVLCCLIWVVAREYIEDIKKSQRGRPHPDRQVRPHVWFTCHWFGGFLYFHVRKKYRHGSSRTTRSIGSTKFTSTQSTRAGLAWLKSKPVFTFIFFWLLSPCGILVNLKLPCQNRLSCQNITQ